MKVEQASEIAEKRNFGRKVGRTPWSAADPRIGHCDFRGVVFVSAKRDRGIALGPGGPPYEEPARSHYVTFSELSAARDVERSC